VARVDALRLVELALALVVAPLHPRQVLRQERLDLGVFHPLGGAQGRRVDGHVRHLHLLEPVAQHLSHLGVRDRRRLLDQPGRLPRQQVVAERGLEAGHAPVLALGVIDPRLAVDAAVRSGAAGHGAQELPHLLLADAEPQALGLLGQDPDLDQGVRGHLIEVGGRGLGVEGVAQAAAELGDLLLAHAVEVAEVELPIADLHGDVVVPIHEPGGSRHEDHEHRADHGDGDGEDPALAAAEDLEHGTALGTPLGHRPVRGLRTGGSGPREGTARAPRGKQETVARLPGG
jgi:hypothetical protein